MVHLLFLSLIIAGIIFILFIIKQTSNLALKIAISLLLGMILSIGLLIIGYLYIAFHVPGFR